MADRVILPQAIDSNGDVVAGAAAYFYESGTTTPLVVYTSAAADTALGVSVAAGSDGAFPAVYATESVRVDIKDPDGVSLPGFPSDGWYVVPAAGVAADTITFSPIEGNEATQVQGAIANLTALWNAVTTFGKSLIAATDAAAARATLGLGGLATLNILDEDDMATDSATRPPSQQSVKTYVDTLGGNASGDAPVFGVRAWINFSGGGTVTILESGNVSSITDNGVGDYTVNFATNMPDGNYALGGSVIQSSGGSSLGHISKTASSVRISTTNNAGPQDYSSVSALIIR